MKKTEIKVFYIWAQEKLKHIELSKFELYDLIAGYLKMSRIDLLCNLNMVLSSQQEADLASFIDQRLNHKPITKILGFTYFYNSKFLINEHVLDPRPETEELVDWIIQTCSYKSVLDLGVGSGCILLSLLQANQNAYGVGVDISDEVLAITALNAKELVLSPVLIKSNWFENVPQQKFDIIVSNPPYVNRYDEIGQEIKYDPDLALYADGAEHYTHIIAHVGDFLSDIGMLFFEVPTDYMLEINACAMKYDLHVEWKKTAADNIMLARLCKCLVSV